MTILAKVALTYFVVVGIATIFTLYVGSKRQ